MRTARRSNFRTWPNGPRVSPTTLNGCKAGVRCCARRVSAGKSRPPGPDHLRAPQRLSALVIQHRSAYGRSRGGHPVGSPQSRVLRPDPRKRLLPVRQSPRGLPHRIPGDGLDAGNVHLQPTQPIIQLCRSCFRRRVEARSIPHREYHPHLARPSRPGRHWARGSGRSARTLASQPGRWRQRTGQHFTRISKIEHGVQAPADYDIHDWCRACAAEDQIPDLIATARAVESSYLEFRPAGPARV